MAESPPRQRFPWAWLMPSLLLLAGLVLWGALAYPRLPGQIPSHVGLSGVDAWTSKSVPAAFTGVFVYAGATVLMALAAVAVVGVKPKESVPPGGEPGLAGQQGMLNRPATAASARAIASAVLALNFFIGIGIAFAHLTFWSPRPDEAGGTGVWTLVAFLGCLAAGLVFVLRAWRRDVAAERDLAARRA